MALDITSPKNTIPTKKYRYFEHINTLAHHILRKDTGLHIAQGCCCCFLTLTDPLRIQPWSQDRRNQTKSNRESEISMESRQKRTDKEVASKGHRRDKIENINKNTQTVETN